jgi:hypothetical protein
LLNDALGEGGQQPHRYQSAHQTSPF